MLEMVAEFNVANDIGIYHGYIHKRIKVVQEGRKRGEGGMGRKGRRGGSGRCIRE